MNAYSKSPFTLDITAQRMKFQFAPTTSIHIVTTIASRYSRPISQNSDEFTNVCEVEIKLRCNEPQFNSLLNSFKNPCFKLMSTTTGVLDIIVTISGLMQSASNRERSVQKKPANETKLRTKQN